MNHNIKRRATAAAICCACSAGATAGVGFDTADGWKYKTRIHSRAPNGTKPAPAPAAAKP